jgi:hypothetical protein
MGMKVRRMLSLDFCPRKYADLQNVVNATDIPQPPEAKTTRRLYAMDSITAVARPGFEDVDEANGN